MVVARSLTHFVHRKNQLRTAVATTQQRSSPSADVLPHVSALAKPVQGFACTGPRPHQADPRSVTPFRSHHGPAPPVSLRTPRALPCTRRVWEPLPARTQSTLIRLRRFNHRLLKPAPGTTPAATDVARLVMSFDHGVTSVGAKAPRPTGYVRGSRLAIVSSRSLRGPFRRTEYRSSLLPSRPTFPCSAPSLCDLTGKGFMPLSSLSCSRSAFVRRNPGAFACSDSSVLPRRDSRRQQALLEPNEPFTRSALRLLVPCPTGGFEALLKASHPL